MGHLALGYLSGKASSKLLNADVNIPVLFLLSTLPDIDLVIPGLQHRGPTHSVIIFFLLFIPLFATYRKRAIPYFIAIAQHPLIGDYLTEKGVQMLWPITTNWYGLGINMMGLVSVSLEWIVFLASLTLMFKTKDSWIILKPHLTNLLLLVPITTAFFPTFLRFPLVVPRALVIPHLVYIAIFTVSMLVDLNPFLDNLTRAKNSASVIRTHD